jgi:hypothetical protein
VEFVGAFQADAVEAELERLRTFMDRHRKGVGYTEVHVRDARPDGLGPLAIGVDQLELLLPKERLGAVSSSVPRPGDPSS